MAPEFLKILAVLGDFGVWLILFYRDIALGELLIYTDFRYK
jgi:hypothetical protein